MMGAGLGAIASPAAGILLVGGLLWIDLFVGSWRRR